ncbi:nucleoside recognition domain-containing protein [Pontibacterium granulatum]|uniref:nucleoside recognition domain-containing protein n=1 Tax=Pontibacterium granulatum TaxID=2036029 RepID=UPI00249B3831|nr:nucleoside recognition domain-containing protein [Pontibacterium granulatum]MDI3323526.1 nucleoside recognition domain-containing protein [Pontibacterium granulatum]
MEQVVEIILASGRSAIDMALYILMPIMVVMLALMKLMDAKGVLAVSARILALFVKVFGVPGLGVFAMLKMLLVSFSAPVATLSLMHNNAMAKRKIAATFAMLLPMSQANVVFPMMAVGLDMPIAIATSLLSGFFSAALAYYVLMPASKDNDPAEEPTYPEPHSKKSVVQILSDGGQEGMKITLAMLPMLMLAICLVNGLRETGVIEWLSGVLAPLMALLGLPEAAVLPLVTKYIAGGTAFMGITLDLMDQGLITAQELNRMAGLVTNPLDIVGVAVLAAAGSRVADVARVAVIAGFAGIALRSVIHLLIY